METVSSCASDSSENYFSTIDSAFVCIREYLENHLGEKSEIGLELVTLKINGGMRQYYKVTCGGATSPNIINVPYYVPAPQAPITTPLAPQEDKWWQTPIVYCGTALQIN